MKKIIAIVGPTASGKTKLANDLAKKFSGEIICADSRTVYKDMEIGTAKPPLNLRKEIKHHLIDIVTPDKYFSVADFQKLAYEVIDHYFQSRGYPRGIPIIVGGTGLYIDAVLEGYILPEIKENVKKLRTNLEEKNTETLLKILAKLDPSSYQEIDHRNRRRIIRAIEVSLLTGKPFSDQKNKQKPKYDFLILGLNLSREKLYQQIDQRVDQMIVHGLVEETKKIIKKYSQNAPGLNTIGYKEIKEYINGKYSLAEAIEKIKFNTHAFARRQLTWFRRNQKIHWVNSHKEAIELAEDFLAEK